MSTCHETASSCQAAVVGILERAVDALLKRNSLHELGSATQTSNDVSGLRVCREVATASMAASTVHDTSTVRDRAAEAPAVRWQGWPCLGARPPPRRAPHAASATLFRTFFFRTFERSLNPADGIFATPRLPGGPTHKLFCLVSLYPLSHCLSTMSTVCSPMKPGMIKETLHTHSTIDLHGLFMNGGRATKSKGAGESSFVPAFEDFSSSPRGFSFSPSRYAKAFLFIFLISLPTAFYPFFFQARSQAGHGTQYITFGDGKGARERAVSTYSRCPMTNRIGIRIARTAHASTIMHW
eukprot:4253244-Prymnesium_polylepis.1